MNTRRGLIVGGACLAAAGAAYQLRPHRHTSLLGAAKIADVVPMRFGDWTGRDVSDLTAPVKAGSLMSTLYGQLIQRVYEHGASGLQIMTLVVHGDTQSNELQLHRPEICYPAYGFDLKANRPIRLQLAPAAALPARMLVCAAKERQENVVYWTRLGEFLPVTGNEQRLDRLKTSFQGLVADGLMARFSTVGADADGSFQLIRGFAPELIRATRAQFRPALIGTRLSLALKSA